MSALRSSLDLLPLLSEADVHDDATEPRPVAPNLELDLDELEAAGDGKPSYIRELLSRPPAARPSPPRPTPKKASIRPPPEPIAANAPANVASARATIPPPVPSAAASPKATPPPVTTAIPPPLAIVVAAAEIQAPLFASSPTMPALEPAGTAVALPSLARPSWDTAAAVAEQVAMGTIPASPFAAVRRTALTVLWFVAFVLHAWWGLTRSGHAWLTRLVRSYWARASVAASAPTAR